MKKTIVPVILCGGSGTRLWPASRENRPKQFLKLMDDKSLLQNTVLRAMRVSGAPAANIVTVTLEAFADDVAEQMKSIDPAAARHILREPGARNTAAAVAYAGAYVEQMFGKDAVLWVLPADHHMGDEEALGASFRAALTAVNDGCLATFGIKPTRPETGYGYIRLGAARGDEAVHAVDAFVEKPNLAIAKTYVEAGNYLWNSGMFLFTAEALLQEYGAHAAGILSGARESMMEGKTPQHAHPAIYMAIEETPFDIAIMEKSSRVAVAPCDPAWSDIGAWESLWEIRPKDAGGNVAEGDVLTQDTKNCFIQSGGNRLIACAGVENLVIVDTGDAILIADRSNSDSLRALVKTLKKTGRAEIALPEFEEPVAQGIGTDENKLKTAA
jgi:mannose-1-phosphate guanylyltransferase/mannose-6-phosphate isomerase